MLKDLFWRLPAAFLAPAYWVAAAWLCFAAVGQDPLDAFFVGTMGAQIATIVIMAAAIVMFALTARWWFARNVGRSDARVY
jgi:hypothetical protein